MIQITPQNKKYVKKYRNRMSSIKPFSLKIKCENSQPLPLSNFQDNTRLSIHFTPNEQNPPHIVYIIVIIIMLRYVMNIFPRPTTSLLLK